MYTTTMIVIPHTNEMIDLFKILCAYSIYYAYIDCFSFSPPPPPYHNCSPLFLAFFSLPHAPERTLYPPPLPISTKCLLGFARASTCDHPLRFQKHRKIPLRGSSGREERKSEKRAKEKRNRRAVSIKVGSSDT